MSKSVNKLNDKLSGDVASSTVGRFSKQQLQILEFIYGYRFVSTKQVQLVLGKAQIQQAQQRLNTLLVKEYIGRNFSSTDRLTGKYASYYLLPKGIQLLKYYGDAKVLRNIYKDRTASERFIAHCLSIGNVYADLVRIYGDKLRFWTKSQLVLDDDQYYDNPDNEHSYDCFPQPLPDGYIEVHDEDGNYGDFLLEVWHDNVPFWVYRNRIKYYVQYVYDDTWKDAVGSELPPVLLVCDSPTLQRRVQRFLKRMAGELDSDELQFLVTNQVLLAGAKPETAIWSEYNEDEEKFIRVPFLIRTLSLRNGTRIANPV